MRFLVDRCVGTKLCDWLRSLGHDVLDCRELGPDPGDRALLQQAVEQARILVTIDTDFGTLVFKAGEAHSGIVRLPDVPPAGRVELMKQVLQEYSEELSKGAMVTIRGERIRVSVPPLRSL